MIEQYHTIRVKHGTKALLDQLVRAWSSPTKGRLSPNMVIEIMVQLAPGRYTDEEIEETQPFSRPSGRPKQNYNCRWCRDKGARIEFDEVVRCENCDIPDEDVDPNDPDFWVAKPRVRPFGRWS